MTIKMRLPGHHPVRNTNRPLTEPVYELLFAVSAAACTVNTHLDFYNWLQNEVSELIPHDILLVAWGDFATGELSYDVSSALPGLSNQAVYDFKGLDGLLCDFFQHTREHGRDWCLLHDVLHSRNGHANGAESGLELMAALAMTSHVVYTMADKRDGHDCMYVFSSKDSVIKIDPLILDFLMPHVDNALRRVECLANATTEHKSWTCPQVDALSEREREVLHWVGMGKSNEEIGAILRISHNTVKNHLKRVFSKMGVSARSQAVQVYSQFHGRKSSAA